MLSGQSLDNALWVQCKGFVKRSNPYNGQLDGRGKNKMSITFIVCFFFFAYQSTFVICTTELKYIKTERYESCYWPWIPAPKRHSTYLLPIPTDLQTRIELWKFISWTRFLVFGNRLNISGLDSSYPESHTDTSRVHTGKRKQKTK